MFAGSCTPSCARRRGRDEAVGPTTSGSRAIARRRLCVESCRPEGTREAADGRVSAWGRPEPADALACGRVWNQRGSRGSEKQPEEESVQGGDHLGANGWPRHQPRAESVEVGGDARISLGRRPRRPWKCQQEAACRVMEAGTKYGSSMGFVRHVIELVCLVNGKARMKVMDEVG